MICNAKPYEGADAFLFVSYSRKDAGIVYPLIERLASAGIRLWYDSGIHGGSVWPEVIADHLSRSAVCLAFISQNAVNSHNCYSELVYAVENKKPLVLIRYDEAQFTKGMKLLLGATQWMDIRGIPSDSDISKILSLELIRPVHGIPDRSIRIQEYCTEEKPEPGRKRKWNPTPYSEPEPLGDSPVIRVEPLPILEDDSDDPQSIRKKDSPEADHNDETVAESTEDSGEKTIADNDDDSLEKTIAAGREIPPTFVVLSGDGAKYRGKIGTTILGRSKAKADVVIPDPDRRISGSHVRIICFEGTHYIEDMGSTNGTWANGTQLVSEERVPVEQFCELLLYRTRVLAAFDQLADELWKSEALLMLRCEETAETRYLWNGKLMLGRDNPWNENVLQDRKISHKHASFRIEGAQCVLKDEDSTNGTVLNNKKMERDAECAVQTGDIIQIGDFHFIVTLITFDGGVRE